MAGPMLRLRRRMRSASGRSARGGRKGGPRSTPRAAWDVVKLNQREEAELGRMFGQKDVVGWLRGELGVAVLAVTRGADGCRLIGGDAASGGAASGDAASGDAASGDAASGSAASGGAASGGAASGGAASEGAASEGATSGDAATVIDQPGFPTTPGGDSVGCGDAFTAVLALGLVHGAPLARIAEAACRYAAAVAGHRGGTPAVPRAEIVAVLHLLGLTFQVEAAGSSA